MRYLVKTVKTENIMVAVRAWGSYCAMGVGSVLQDERSCGNGWWQLAAQQGEYI